MKAEGLLSVRRRRDSALLRMADRLRVRRVLGLARRGANEALWVVMPRRFWERQLQGLPVHWVFLCGCNNSGTTIMSRILNSHPEIDGIPGEGQFRTRALLADRDVGLGRLFTEGGDMFRWTEGSRSDVDVLRVKYDWLNSVRARRGIVLEKTPANTLRMRWLQQRFGNASFIGLARSPFAVCEGIMRRTGVDAERAARHWKTANETMLDDAHRLERFTLVTYEQLVNDTDRLLDEVAAFLGLGAGFELDMGAEYDVHNAAGQQARLTDMNPGSLERLSHDEIAVIEGICRDLWDRVQARVG